MIFLGKNIGGESMLKANKYLNSFILYGESENSFMVKMKKCPKLNIQ
jgi:hypothetical protein